MSRVIQLTIVRRNCIFATRALLKPLACAILCAETFEMIDSSRNPEPDVVGEQFGGKWIAWVGENVHIVASGETAQQAKPNAMAIGVIDPTVEFVPPSDAAFAGGV